MKKILKFNILLLVVVYCYAFTCKHDVKSNSLKAQCTNNKSLSLDTAITTIHIMVALCDNTYQGIVPVPKGIGNGQNCNTNLYWGCGYGIRSFFKKSKEWQWIKTIKKDSLILERIVFKHKTKNVYMVADAYNGQYIQTCTVDFLNACAGKMKDTLHVNQKIIGINGHAQLISYIGHNGLMDFELPDTFKNSDTKTRDCIILACASKNYFAPYIQKANAKPLVWTSNLMCPEAYTIHDAITGYLGKENDEQIRTRAAAAYSKYHPSCSISCAKRLLVTGF